MRRTTPALLLLTSLAVTSCTPTPPPPVAPAPRIATVERPLDAVAASIIEALRQAGLQATSMADAARVRIEAVDTGPIAAKLADCPRITLADPHTEDNSGRFRYVEAHSQELQISVDLDAAGASTTVHIYSDYHGLYLNSFTNSNVRQICGGTGDLERRLIDAATGKTGGA